MLVERGDGQQQRLDVQRHARAFSVHERSRITLAAGDKLRITQNGSVIVAPTNLPEHQETSSAVRVDNGTLLTVTGFTAAGAVECAGGVVLPENFGHFTSGYCLTSHASQGKTVDQVLIAENSASAQSAGSRKQGYVSLSRGRESVRIYTDDRRAVEAAWANDGERLSALDLLARHARSRRHRSIGRAVRWIATRIRRRLGQALRHRPTALPVPGQLAVHNAICATTAVVPDRRARRNRQIL